MKNIIWVVEFTTTQFDRWDKPQLVRRIDHSLGWFDSLEKCAAACTKEGEKPFAIVKAED